ncbi:GNAT family N-acetyltransferase [Ruminococcaceae bacterium OttesenSCG-928-L11]|nr:GNAT family N-acetyltransferase [Ruminococcaceae bacterium OttesenSCG-928-L11]
MEIREIAYASPEYRQEMELRHHILRMPLGMNLYEEDLSGEAEDIHIGAFDGDTLVGCLILTPAGDGVCKMRQVAVAAERQGAGIGSALCRYAEQLARQRGYRRIVLHARQTAIPFYESLAYRGEGALFTEVGILHRGMHKDL